MYQASDTHVLLVRARDHCPVSLRTLSHGQGSSLLWSCTGGTDSLLESGPQSHCSFLDCTEFFKTNKD